MSAAEDFVDLEQHRRRQRTLVIARIAAIESAVEREEEMLKAKKEFGWSIASLREEVDKARKRAREDAAKKRKEDDAANPEGKTAPIITGSEAIALFNKDRAAIRVGGKIRILTEDTDKDGLPIFELLSEGDFQTEAANKGVVHIPAADDEGPGIFRPASQSWLQSPDRREYSGIVFRPGDEMKVEPGANWPWPKFYNLWRGWGVEPSEKGSCEKFKRHLLDNVCRGHQGRYDWLWNWMAHIFQKPQEKPGVAVALRGSIGAGKTLSARRSAFSSALGTTSSLAGRTAARQVQQTHGRFAADAGRRGAVGARSESGRRDEGFDYRKRRPSPDLQIAGVSGSEGDLYHIIRTQPTFLQIKITTQMANEAVARCPHCPEWRKPTMDRQRVDSKWFTTAVQGVQSVQRRNRLYRW